MAGLSCLALVLATAACPGDDDEPENAGGAGGAGAGAGGGASVSSGASNPTGGSTSSGNPTGGSTSSGNPTGGSTTSTSSGDPTGGSTTSATTGTGSTDPSSTTSTGSGTPTGACPANATFCADFEGGGIPEGATLRPQDEAVAVARDVTIDASTAYAGTSSLRVVGGSGYTWRMLSVPAPGPKFWVRLYVRSTEDLGQEGHNTFFQAMGGNGERNMPGNLEVSEQYCQVVLNLSDDVVLSEGGEARCGSGGTKLDKGKWHCMEAHFDGPRGDVQVYANGTKIIDKTNWTKVDFKTFSFGYLGFHGPGRTMWYDDVAVAPERIGCAP